MVTAREDPQKHTIKPEDAKGVELDIVYAETIDKAERALPRDIMAEQVLHGQRDGDIIYKEEEVSRSSTAVNTPNRESTPSFIRTLKQRREHNRKKKIVQGQLYQAFKHPQVDDCPEGYPQLAALQASDDSFAIFRMFTRSTYRVLLHLQAEISTLEKELDALDARDAEPGSATSYRLISARYEEGWDEKQKVLLERLEERLGKYSTYIMTNVSQWEKDWSNLSRRTEELLLKEHQLKTIPNPLQKSHRALFNWIQGKRPVVEGEDEWILYEDDLVPLANIDPLESALSSSFLNFSKHLPTSFPSHSPTPSSPETHITYHSQNMLSHTSKLVIVLVSVSILTVPLFILFWADLSKAWMSATVLISVLVFSSLLLVFWSKARVQDVLVGSAAYCAVLATFLGNLGVGGECGGNVGT